MFLRKRNHAHTRTNPDEEGIWSDEKRIEAVSTYIILGSMAKTRDATGIPLNTLWSWKQSTDWWADLEAQIRAERDAEASSELTGIFQKALAGIKERLVDGDYVYNPRTGDIARVPVSASALGKIATTLLDKRVMLENQYKDTKEDAEPDTVKLEKQLRRLAKSFTDFVESRNKEEKVIEGEYAIHEERKEGLQAGTPMGTPQEAQPSQG